VIRNNGILTKVGVGGTGATTFRMPVENNGGRVILLSLLGQPVKFAGGYTQTGGSTTIDASLLGVTGKFSIRGGLVSIDGGTLEVDGDLEETDGSLTAVDSTLEVTGRFDQSGGSASFSDSEISVAVVLAQTGGDFLLDDSALTVLAGVQVSDDATFRGTGTIVGDVSNAGRVHVGGSGAAGGLVVNGNYTQTADGNLFVDIGGPTAQMQYDQFVVSGTVTLEGTLTVSLVDGYVPDPGDAFRVLTYGTRVGTFTTIVGLDLGGGGSLVPVYGTDALALLTV
jgi:hypothetical protein